MEEIVIDTRGLQCPLPMLRVRKAMLSATSGTQAVILATDPGTGQDLRDFCEVRGYSFLAGETNEGVLRAVIRKC